MSLSESSRRQLVTEVRCGRHTPAVLRHQLHPASRPLQKRRRTHQHSAETTEDRRADPQHQTHVVVEGQPRDDSGVAPARFRARPNSRTPAAGNWPADCCARQRLPPADGSTRMCTANTRWPANFRARHRVLCASPGPANRHRRSTGQIRRLRIDVFRDTVDHRGRGENDGGRRIAQYRENAFIAGPPSGTESGTAISPACIAPETRRCSPPMRCHYQRPVTGRSTNSERLRDAERPPIKLRPSQALATPSQSCS